MIWTSARRPSAVKLAVRAVEGVEVEAGSLSESPNDWSEKTFLARFLELPPRCVEDLFIDSEVTRGCALHVVAHSQGTGQKCVQFQNAGKKSDRSPKYKKKERRR
jgi:hypothetical protein